MINYCGICPHNGNAILTSYPPKIRCELTGKLHYTNDACDVDMVAVVRCKDCFICETRQTANYLPFLYCELHDCNVLGDFFCSWGERREDAESD